MRIDEFNYSSADEDLGDFLGSHYQFEVFTPGRERLERLFVPLITEIKKYNIPTTIVGGTNGKGEVSLLLEEIALQNNVTPILWTSPHILTVRERFCFNGKMIEASSLMDLFTSNEKLTSDLSYYEFLFYCFCKHTLKLLSQRDGPFVLILEVGLGGRLDTTNLFDADVACLTNVGRDHIDILGSSLSAILIEKIAISRSGRDLVTGISQKVLIGEARKYCLENKVIMHEPILNLKNNEILNFKLINLALAKNVWLLLSNLFKISLTNLDNYCLPNLWGRPLVVTDSEHTFTLLGTHNLDGLRSLSQSIENSGMTSGDEIWVALTRTRDSEISTFLTLLSTLKCLGKKIMITSFDHPRATDLGRIEKCVDELLKMDHIEIDAEWDDRIKNRKIYKNTIVIGSYFFVGTVFRSLLSNGFSLSKDISKRRN